MKTKKINLPDGTEVAMEVYGEVIFGKLPDGSPVLISSPTVEVTHPTGFYPKAGYADPVLVYPNMWWNRT